MKVLVVVNQLTHTSIPLEMANQLSRVCDVTVFSLYDEEKKASQFLQSLGISCKLAPSKGKRRIVDSLKRLYAQIRTGGYDIVHTHHAFSSSMARFFAHKCKVKNVHTVHANYHSYSFFQNLVIGSTLQYANAVIYNSQSTLEGMYQWQKKRVSKAKQLVIYNGVNCEQIRSVSADKAIEICDKLGVASDEFVYAMVGRFVKVKNHLSVLEAYDLFLRQDTVPPKTKLMLIGDGPQREEIEKRIEKSELLKQHVLLTGMLPREAVYSLLKRMNGFVVASFYEGFCNSMVEALAAGVPPMVSKIAVFRELLGENSRIYSFDPKDCKAIAECMNGIYVDYGAENELEEVRKEWLSIALQYDIAVCRDKYYSLYTEICDE